MTQTKIAQNNQTDFDNLNQVNLVGRVGQFPETQYFPSGSCLTKLSIAVNRPQKDAEPDWVTLEIWGKQAEVAANYIDKGSLIAIQGELKLDEWVDNKTQMPRSKPVIRVTNLELLSSSKSSADTTNNSPQNNPSPTPNYSMNTNDF
jgi:single-strand DNA-binding protein